MIGACDICNAQRVKVANLYVSGIETFVCYECVDEQSYADLRESGGLEGAP